MAKSGMCSSLTLGPDLESSLKGVSSPVSFMDFETFSPAIPMFAGTSPYQTIPFQWSIHVRDDDGNLTVGRPMKSPINQTCCLSQKNIHPIVRIIPLGVNLPPRVVVSGS